VSVTVEQLASPWSSNSGSSCQSSSVEIKEFFYDDELIDTADWTLGRHVSLHDGAPLRHSSTSIVDSKQPAATNKSTDSAADKTLTAGVFYCCLNVFYDYKKLFETVIPDYTGPSHTPSHQVNLT